MALDLATEARDDINKLGISMTPDQKLYTARIYATSAVAQELAGDTSGARAERSWRLRCRDGLGLPLEVVVVEGDPDIAKRLRCR